MKKIKSNLNYSPTPGEGKRICPGRKILTFYITVLLILILGVYTNARQQKRKEKSNFVKPNTPTQTRRMPQYRPRTVHSARPSHVSRRPRVENKNRGTVGGKINSNHGNKGKLKRRTGTITRRPRKNFPQQNQNTKVQNRRGTITNGVKKREHPCNPNNSYYTHPGCGGITYYNEGYVEPSNVGPGGSNRVPVEKEREYVINDSFDLQPILVEKIKEYNAKHLNETVLESPLTPRSRSLTYQLLDIEALIEHMEKKIEYYRGQLDAVRNSEKSPTEKEIWERFWLERINRLEDSIQKEKARIAELHSEIADEHQRHLNR